MVRLAGALSRPSREKPRPRRPARGGAVARAGVDNKSRKDINRLLQDMAQELRADYLDIFSLFVTESGKPMPGLLLDDGVHLSADGYRVWADAVDAFLRSR